MTGVHGWYPLLPPESSLATPISGHIPNQSRLPLVACAYVGAVEVSAAFTRTTDKELLLSSARECGWGSLSLSLARTEEEGRGLEVEVKVLGLWTQRNVIKTTSADQPPLTVIRYRFFDLGKNKQLPPFLSSSPPSDIVFDSVSMCSNTRAGDH